VNTINTINFPPRPIVDRSMARSSRNISRASPFDSKISNNSKGGQDDKSAHSIIDPKIYAPVIAQEGIIVEAWISIDALLLLGCLHCGGFDSQKAQVFHRVIAPELGDTVMLSDKDLRKSMMFMITAATILEEMTR